MLLTCMNCLYWGTKADEKQCRAKRLCQKLNGVYMVGSESCTSGEYRDPELRALSSLGRKRSS